MSGSISDGRVRHTSYYTTLQLDLKHVRRNKILRSSNTRMKINWQSSNFKASMRNGLSRCMFRTFLRIYRDLLLNFSNETLTARKWRQTSVDDAAVHLMQISRINSRHKIAIVCRRFVAISVECGRARASRSVECRLSNRLTSSTHAACWLVSRRRLLWTFVVAY